MSCLSLGLPPPKKAWQILASKLQKRPRRQNRRRPAPSIFDVRRRVFKRRRAHVFVDRLFKEPPEGIILEHRCLDALSVKYVPSPRGIAATVDRPAPEAGKDGGGEDRDGSDAKTCEADDMWESVGLASPLTHGIDERAEEFISKFRAEMERQEMAARSL